MKSFLILLLLKVCFAISNNDLHHSKDGCPESVDVEPCTCTTTPFTYLQCRNLSDSETLRNVFDQSANYRFKEVHIELSHLPFLPHDIFEKAPVMELHLYNVTLAQIFDRPPKNSADLEVLHIENTQINRGIIWELFKPLINLRILNIYNNYVKVIGRDFSKYVTKYLQQISFYGTKTRHIMPGAFKDFKELGKVAVDACLLTELTRDIFPIPFNVRVLYFNDNQLKSIPDDMFKDMPYLQTVGLRNNQLSTIAASVFQDSFTRLIYFIIDDNPIICDCRMQWLVESKPRALKGTCAYPSKFRGKEIQNLKLSNFRC